MKVSKILLFILSILFVSNTCFAQFEYTYNDVTLKYTIIDYKQKTCQVSINSNLSGEIVIPETAYDGTKPYTVTAIGSSAFYRCPQITSVVIPNTVTIIGNSAFATLDKLQSVTLGNSVETLGSGVFSSCTALNSIDIPNSVTKMGLSIFEYCENLKTVRLSQNTTSIGINAFAGCSSLTSIDIPNSVTRIEQGAFQRCTALESLTIGNSVVEIGGCAFWECTSLSSVTIPNSVEEIGFNAFYLCENIHKVTLGSSVKKIAGDAFSFGTRNSEGTLIGKGSADVFSYAANPPICGSDPFKFTGIAVYVPEGKKEIYDSADMWCDHVIYEFDDKGNVLPSEIQFDSSIDYFKRTFEIGEIYQLKATIIPQLAQEHFTIAWESSDSECVSINSNGEICAVREGTATITASTNNGKCIETCNITVLPSAGISQVENEAASKIEVYGLNGILLSDKCENLMPGFYIVKEGTKTKKVFIK